MALISSVFPKARVKTNLPIYNSLQYFHTNYFVGLEIQVLIK